jgi:hypothetical protein
VPGLLAPNSVNTDRMIAAMVALSAAVIGLVLMWLMQCGFLE